ncbi:unnamed protein product [Adineta steineri]|uniref:AB hydrolase-1 domain-containing protein n=1 Tax=Adineta steineri TaxID=433720 RepID=A0A820ARJ1_9BILA|nr:unnamed protein product [Adineta steineri]
MFSKRFDQVYDDTKNIWHSQQYLFTREYYTRSPFLPPISLFYDIYHLCRTVFYAIRRVCFKKSADGKAKVFKMIPSNENRTKEWYEFEGASTYEYAHIEAKSLTPTSTVPTSGSDSASNENKDGTNDNANGDIQLVQHDLAKLIASNIIKGFTSEENTCTKDSRPIHREYFYVGGEYVYDTSSQGFVMTGQMYVEHLTSPYGIQQPYPLVLMHGNAMTGTNWLNTPDGRPGWASYFLQQGYDIYIIDQPARGRSIWLPNSNMTVKTYSANMMEKRFTATSFYKLWPQAILHTQWPGDDNTTKGRMGDQIFDAFYASTVQFVASEVSVQTMMQKAGAALLDKIGAAILLTHSQSGSFGWLIADIRPNLVKAIVSIEPKGPPFREAVFSNKSSRSWGITDIPITYDPIVNSSSDLLTVEIPSIHENYTSCILQKTPARTLTNLVNISVLIETSQASYHAVYDHCTIEFLQQAGVKVDFIRLEDIEIYGNGHMQMMEKNNLHIADILRQWIRKTVHIE